MGNFEKRYLDNISEQEIHSYRTRIKDPEHLIVKIIRKRQENLKKYGQLDKSNYEKFLTDLIGIRCFILFKTDWEIFHKYIVEEIENNPKYYVKDFDDDISHIYIAEMPKVHIRAGDARKIYDMKRFCCRMRLKAKKYIVQFITLLSIEVHILKFKSVHYLKKAGKKLITI